LREIISVDEKCCVFVFAMAEKKLTVEKLGSKEF